MHVQLRALGSVIASPKAPNTSTVSRSSRNVQKGSHAPLQPDARSAKGRISSSPLHSLNGVRKLAELGLNNKTK